MSGKEDTGVETVTEWLMLLSIAANITTICIVKCAKHQRADG